MNKIALLVVICGFFGPVYRNTLEYPKILLFIICTYNRITF